MEVQRWPWSTIWALFGVTLGVFVALWQYMFAMLAFIGIQGGIWRPNVLKVVSLHLAGWAITKIETDVFTESHFLYKVAPKSSPKGSQGHLWIPFWKHFMGLGFEVLWLGFEVLGSGRPKTRKNTRKSPEWVPNGAAAALAYWQNARFCISYVFLRVLGHVAGRGSCRERG